MMVLPFSTTTTKCDRFQIDYIAYTISNHLYEINQWHTHTRRQSTMNQLIISDLTPWDESAVTRKIPAIKKNRMIKCFNYSAHTVVVYTQCVVCCRTQNIWKNHLIIISLFFFSSTKSCAQLKSTKWKEKKNWRFNNIVCTVNVSVLLVHFH